MKHFVKLLGHFKIWLQIKCVVQCNHSVCWKSEYTKFKLKFRSIFFYPHQSTTETDMKNCVCIYRGETEEKEREAKCLLKHTGYVWWLVHRTHKSACLFDVTNYPFDEHTCHMWFQSIEVCLHAVNLFRMLKLILPYGGGLPDTDSLDRDPTPREQNNRQV